MQMMASPKLPTKWNSCCSSHRNGRTNQPNQPQSMAKLNCGTPAASYRSSTVLSLAPANNCVVRLTAVPGASVTGA